MPPTKTINHTTYLPQVPFCHPSSSAFLPLSMTVFSMHTIHSTTRQYHYQRTLMRHEITLSPERGKKMPFHSTHSVWHLLSPKKRKFTGAIDTNSSSHTVKIQFDKNFIVVYFITNALREMYKNTLTEGRGKGMSKEEKRHKKSATRETERWKTKNKDKFSHLKSV